MQLYRTAQRRLDPHWDRLHTMLMDDPVIPEENVREHQRLFSRVSEVMHCLSHAQHAMSDILLNCNAQPPRQLRSRPLMISSMGTAVVSRHIAPVVHRTPRSASASRVPATRAAAPSGPAASGATAGPNETAAAQPMETDPPRHAEGGVTAEVTPIVVGIEIEPEMIDASSGTPGWRAEVLENLLQSVDAIPTQPPASSAATSTAASSSSSSSSSSNSQQQSTQDSRARVNAQTQPTTSTRTRLSTQVFNAPLGPPLGLFGPMGPMGQPGNNFDVLLPCNSHHHTPCPLRPRSRHVAERQRSWSVPPGNRQARQVRPQAAQPGVTIRGAAGPTGQPGGAQEHPAGSGMETSLLNLLQNLSSGGGNDAGMVNVIQRVIMNMFSGGNNGQSSETIASFLENISDYSYTPGQDIITDLLMCLARVLTLSELMGLLAGSPEVMAKIQQPLQLFIRQRLGIGANVSADELREEVLKLLDDSYPNLEAFVQPANIVDGVHYPETLHEFLSQRLTGLLMYISTSTQEAFSRGFFDVCQLFLADLVNLSVRCFSDGQTSLEQLLRSQLSTISEDVGPNSIGSWTMSAAIGHFRNYMAGVGEADRAALERFVVRTEDVPARRAEREKRIESRNETFETPRTSPELMDVSQDEEDEAPSVVEAPVASGSPHRFPASLLPRSGMGPDMVIGREPWHRSVPSEWVPIIARDVQVQAPLADESGPGRQAPFSDAYLTTVPAKKRRLASCRKAEGSVKDTIETSMKDALLLTRVQPKTSKDEVAKGASSNAKVEKTLTDAARNSMKRRLEQDKDFTPDKFPNCKEFLDKSK